MASAQLRGERDRYDGGELRAPEVVDVVVLRDDEALPFPLGQRVDCAVELEQNRSPLEGELDRVRVRHVDRSWRLPRRAVPEATAVRPGGDVGDDVELLPRLLERALEREVVVRAHDQLVRGPALAHQRGNARQKAVERRRLDCRFEQPVQLVVERARPLHRRDVLRDSGEIDGTVVGNLERARKVLREVADAVQPEDGNDATGEQRPHDLRLLVQLSAAGVG